MESETFRKWLAEHGCRFDHHEHEKRGEGQVIVTVHRQGRKAEVPLGGSHQSLDPRVVRRACDELGLDWSNLPGPAGRVLGTRCRARCRFGHDRPVLSRRNRSWVSSTRVRSRSLSAAARSCVVRTRSPTSVGSKRRKSFSWAGSDGGNP